MIKKFITLALFLGAIVTLLSLSFWQVQRLNWKQDMIAHLDAEYKKDPAQNIFNFSQLQNLNQNNSAIRYGQVTGTFIFEKEILWGPKPLDGKIGYNVVTPLKLDTGEYVLVNRGWIEESQKDFKKADIETSSPVTVTGLFRKPDWNIFTPNNSPANNIWTKPDIQQIAQEKNLSPIAPVMAYAHELSIASAPVKLNKQKWYPRNKHKQYAIFWFVMALTFVSVFGMFRYRQFKGA